MRRIELFPGPKLFLTEVTQYALLDLTGKNSEWHPTYFTAYATTSVIRNFFTVGKEFTWKVCSNDGIQIVFPVIFLENIFINGAK